MECGLEGQPATSAAAPMAAPAATPAPEARVVGAAPPCPQGLTEGTLVYGNDGRVHHVRTADMRLMLDFACDAPGEEGRLIFFTEVKQLQTDGPHVIAEPGVLDARMQLTHVQPAQQQGFATDHALEEYLASAGLTLRDVPFDGDCWLSVVAPYITCPDGRPCHQVQWSGVKFFTVKLREALVEYIHTNPTWSDGSGRRPEWLNAPEFISDVHTGKAHSDEHSFLVLASMAKRVLQVYRVFPTREEVVRRKWPPGVNHKNLIMPDCDNAIYGQYAPFSMQYFCPPPEEPLTSNEPIRILHMLEVPLYDPKLPADDQTWVTYPGHFMRILTEEAAGKEEAEMERLRKGKRVTRTDGAPAKKSKKPSKTN
ncbi:hypothetical protein CYMTET_54984 [Cymbomonas tetramitiformis]|uniref:Uncharacterized protein n=1 Tax=Cymbomonas tetramitiformis TaxID=36881 RepID=A0AAE0BDT6_9CHLO|nr:hypothetical protein CYMTET_54984 [Cymbomonas tetramitiformis]